MLAPDSESAASFHAACVCGSGLAPAQCCGRDVEGAPSPAVPDTLSSLARDAAAAIEAGDLAGAGRSALALLTEAPDHVGGLAALCRLRQSTGPGTAVLALLRRLVQLEPNVLWIRQDLARHLLAATLLGEAEGHARDAIRLDPQNLRSHHLLGMILTEAHRPQVGEFHYRRAIALSGASADPILLANCAWNLKLQGRLEESRRLYEQSAAGDPGVLKTWLGWAQMEEAARDLERSHALLDQAEQIDPESFDVKAFRVTVLARQGALPEALDLLDLLAGRRPDGLTPDEELQKGQILDKLGRFDEAFAAFAKAKHLLRIGGRRYDQEAAEQLIRRLGSFFIASRLQILPRAEPAGGPQPAFIVGAPRSGTTLVEQMLSMHPAIAAGDELPCLSNVTGTMPGVLNSPLAYPEALAELWMGDQQDGLERLRDDYLRGARQAGAPVRGKSFFTDKTPFNEIHLGLIALLFPKAPVIHLLRHPLDVVLSMFSHNMTHGFDCSVDLAGAAQYYARTMGLVAHYRREVQQRYLSVRYEDLVREPEAQLRRMLGLIGVGFDRRCLNFHENRRYARTASYAQVTEALYVRSCNRYRNYLRHLRPIIPILEPVIFELGYEI